VKAHDLSYFISKEINMSNYKNPCGCGGGECSHCWEAMVRESYDRDPTRLYCTCNHEYCGTCNIYKRIKAENYNEDAEYHFGIKCDEEKAKLIPKVQRCIRCDGTGNECYSMYRKCSACDGTGRKGKE
jgi:hypothetical protein